MCVVWYGGDYWFVKIWKLVALAGQCLLTEEEASDDDEGRQNDGVDNHGSQPEFGDGFLIHVVWLFGCALAGGKGTGGYTCIHYDALLVLRYQTPQLKGEGYDAQGRPFQGSMIGELT